MVFARCIRIWLQPLALIGYIWLSFGPNLWAAGFEFPQDLNANERATTLEIFGLGTAPKFLSNAYPLGGYKGLEISVSVETFSVKKIEEFRNDSTDANSVLFPKVTIAKGIFNNSDLFFNFIPFNETTRISKYGLQYRWSFYQARFFPLNVSMLMSGNSANIDNQLITRTLSSDIIAASRLGDLSVFISGGYVASSGSFNGGTQGITDSNFSERASVQGSHLSVGLTYQPGRFIFGAAIDQYRETVANIKVGLNL